MTSSRMCATPASMDDGCAWIVVERAYTIHPFPTRGSAPVAPPVQPTPSSGGLPMAMGNAGALARDRRLETAGQRTGPVGWTGEYRCAGCGHRASPYRRFDRISTRVLLPAG